VTRAYRSPVRQEQMALTRERILAAFVDELAAGGDDFAVSRVAARAGVSVRTVYQHFPNREAQIEAVAAWIEEQLGPDKLPTSAVELPAYTRQRYRMFFEHEKILRAQLNGGIATEVRKRRRRRREAAIDACVATTGVPPAVARVAGAIIKELIGAPLGLQLIDAYHLTPEESSRVTAWTVQLIVAALQHQRGPS
jgi:AcrR family transcriptional regulator